MEYHYGATTPRQVLTHEFRPIRLSPMDNPPPPPPQPIIHTTALPPSYVVPGNYSQNPPTNTKTEMMEMMMLQSAQMHQMVMNQMMMQSIPKNTPESGRRSSRVLEDDDVYLSRRPQRVYVDRQVYPQLPPMGYPPQPAQYTPRYYPAELEPLQQPRVRQKKAPVRKKTTPRPQTPVSVRKPKKVYGNLPFPGPWALRKFRHAAYAVFFTKVLEKLRRQKRNNTTVTPAVTSPTRFGPDFIFGIKLKEVVAALHKIYLAPANKVGSVLRQYSSPNSRDLVESLNGGKPAERSAAFEDISYIIENITYEMTDNMPSSGVLGTHHKSIVVDMCREGKIYPKGYMWQIEKDLFQVDYSGRTVNVEEFESFMFVSGVYLARGIVTTLILKPVDYGLLEDNPGPKAQRNLKLLATVCIYIYRRLLVPSGQPPTPLPYEISKYLFPDSDMKEVYSKCKQSLDYADKLIRNWGKEYVSRIRPCL